MRGVGRAAFAVVAMLVTAGCVGPSRTDRDYGEKVEGTAKAVASAAQTALLGVETAERGKAYQPYLSILLRDAEDEAGWAQEALDTVQPPSGAADEMHDQVADIVSEVVDVLRELRVEVRRGHLAALPGIAAPLRDLADRLDRIAEERT
ncbi:MAG: hypothetical protein QOE45_564 [Frankiaceae bacterium]|nr:hypothetical protein [Frankiaceae bacterium]